MRHILYYLLIFSAVVSPTLQFERRPGIFEFPLTMRSLKQSHTLKRRENPDHFEMPENLDEELMLPLVTMAIGAMNSSFPDQEYDLVFTT
ncbi:hypothetical protein BX666DRAFT_1946705 [Dichotomocladium elegans]|nr:hypothetical protein BX666DRAFT_1946705 [Dichotomocladium elegans]